MKWDTVKKRKKNDCKVVPASSMYESIEARKPE
jgi:hypothetical protein